MLSHDSSPVAAPRRGVRAVLAKSGRGAAALTGLMLLALGGCASANQPSLAQRLASVDHHQPAGYHWLSDYDKGWGGCPDTYRGWC